jgi:hypothetical protein
MNAQDLVRVGFIEADEPGVVVASAEVRVTPIAGYLEIKIIVGDAEVKVVTHQSALKVTTAER